MNNFEKYIMFCLRSPRFRWTLI